MKKLKKDTDMFYSGVRQALQTFQDLFDGYGDILLIPREPGEFSSSVIGEHTWVHLNYAIYLAHDPNSYFATLLLSPVSTIIIRIDSKHWHDDKGGLSLQTPPISFYDSDEIERILKGMGTLLEMERDQNTIQLKSMEELFNAKHLVH